MTLDEAECNSARQVQGAEKMQRTRSCASNQADTPGMTEAGGWKNRDDINVCTQFYTPRYEQVWRWGQADTQLKAFPSHNYSVGPQMGDGGPQLASS